MNSSAHRLFNMQEYAVQKKRIRESMEEEGMIVQRQQQRHLMHLAQSNNHGSGFNGNGVGDDAPVATGPAILTNIMSYFIKPKETIRRAAVRTGLIPDRVMELAQTDAATLLPSNLMADSGGRAVSFANMLADFDRTFVPVQLGGTFNTVGNEELFPENTDSSPATFSVEFLQSINLQDQFVMLPGTEFISWSCFLHLCRSPVLFCMDTEELEAGLAAMYLYPLSDPAQDSDDYEAFQEWHTEVGKAKFDPLNRTFLTLFHMFGNGALVQRAAMNLRSLFLTRGLTQDSRQKQDLYEFLNMEYQAWRQGFQEYMRLIPKGTNVDVVFRPYVSVASMAHEHVMSENKERAAEENDRVEAQRLDLFYANLVHGAAVRVNMSEVWAPDQELEHSDRDTDSFFKVMWKGLRDVLQVSVTNQLSTLGTRGQAGGLRGGSVSGTEFVNHLIKSIRRVKETKRLMKEIWEQSKDYRISDRVHMTEIQILQRLKNDGVFPYLDRNTSAAATKNGKRGMQNIHLCFFMRRSTVFRYAFAAAVGKRFHSERLTGPSRNQIIEHHRSVQWAEQEYFALLQVVQDNGRDLRKHLDKGELPENEGDEEAFLFTDYCDMLRPSPYVSERDVMKTLQWERR